jgi:chromosome partitioning protein
MPIVVVANPKGGVGKTTLSTNVAGYFASQGHGVMLGDADRQQSSALWLRLRPPTARPIHTWEVSHDQIARPPKDVTHVVLDTPAGLHGKRFKEVLKMANKVIVPLQPSIFDIYATRDFLDELTETRRAAVGIVGMRVDPRTIAGHAELHPPGRARAHAVRRGALARGKGPAAVEGHLRVAGPLSRLLVARPTWHRGAAL